MRIVCISDTLSMHHDLVVPDGDMLIHAGDLTMKSSRGEIMTAFAWLDKMPREQVIFVPGNHDFGFERHSDLLGVLRAKFPRLHVLMDGGATIAGKRDYGSPSRPYVAGQEQAKRKWATIPDDTES